MLSNSESSCTVKSSRPALGGSTSSVASCIFDRSKPCSIKRALNKMLLCARTCLSNTDRLLHNCSHRSMSIFYFFQYQSNDMNYAGKCQAVHNACQLLILDCQNNLELAHRALHYKFCTLCTCSAVSEAAGLRHRGLQRCHACWLMVVMHGLKVTKG